MTNDGEQKPRQSLRKWRAEKKKKSGGASVAYSMLIVPPPPKPKAKSRSNRVSLKPISGK